MSDLLPKMRPHCPCESMDSEDSLFILYTSGSTGMLRIETFIFTYVIYLSLESR
jgi:acyl-CoA synthetase (AMP-forming)/AMP-acid ligase II